MALAIADAYAQIENLKNSGQITLLEPKARVEIGTFDFNELRSLGNHYDHNVGHLDFFLLPEDEAECLKRFSTSEHYRDAHRNCGSAQSTIRPARKLFFSELVTGGNESRGYPIAKRGDV